MNRESLPDIRQLMRVALIIAFVQFTNALEYMLFNPIFSYMARDFAVPVTFAGYVTGIYTLAAIVSGLVAFFWIDRWNKRAFLSINMLLLGVITLAITCIDQFSLLLLFRFMAGLLGGTSMGVGISLLVNQAPVQLRAKMMAIVIAAFSAVSIIGMPIMLFLCQRFGWPSALWLIALFCLISALLVRCAIPAEQKKAGAFKPLTISADVLMFASTNGLGQFSPLLLIPVLVPVMTQIMALPDEQLPWLFLSGGVAGYLATKVTGALIQHCGSILPAVLATLLLLLSLGLLYYGSGHAYLFIILYMAATYARLVASSAQALSFPEDQQRASFSTLQTALTSVATTLAFLCSATLLGQQQLSPQGLQILLLLSAGSALLLPVMMALLQSRLTGRVVSR